MRFGLLLPAVVGAFAAMALALAFPARAQTLDVMVLPGGSSPTAQATPVTYNLPHYGPVTVSWQALQGWSAANVVTAPMTVLNGQTIPGSPAAVLPANVRMLGLYPEADLRRYTLTFTFENGQPDTSQLRLLVFNLGRIGTANTTITPAVPMTGSGTFTAPTFPHQVTQTGGVIQSASTTSAGSNNSGIAAFRPNAALPLVGGKPTLCKVAGEGVAVGTMVNFNLTVGGASQTYGVPAGPAPGGYCRMLPVSFPEGTGIRIVEQVPANQQVSDITIHSPLPLDDVVAERNRQTATVEMRLVGLNEVSFTNSRVFKEGQSGYLEICKQGGSQAMASFNVTGSAVTSSTPPGSCTAPIRVEVTGDKTLINEVGPAQPFACTAFPADRLIGFDQATGECAVQVVPGGVSDQTVVTIFNR
jgi:hypothetical protein